MKTYLIIPACLLTACFLEPKSPSVAVRMDSASFARDSASYAYVGFTLTNVGSAPAYFEGCGGQSFAYAAEVQSSTGWTDAFGRGMVCLQSLGNGFLLLSPGQLYHDVEAWNLPNTSATYRLRVYFGSTDAAPYAYSSYSSSFEIQ